MANFCLLSNANASASAPQMAVQVRQPGEPAGAAPIQAIQAILTGIGSVTATVKIAVSNDENVLIGTGVWSSLDAGTSLTLSGAAPQSGTFVVSQPWKYWGTYLSAITGTGATVNVFLSA